MKLFAPFLGMILTFRAKSFNGKVSMNRLMQERFLKPFESFTETFCGG